MPKSKVSPTLIPSPNLNCIQIPDSDSEPEPKRPPPKRPRPKASRPPCLLAQSKPPAASDSEHDPHPANPSKKVRTAPLDPPSPLSRNASANTRSRSRSVPFVLPTVLTIPQSREFIEDSDDNQGPVLNTPNPSKKLKGAEQPADDLVSCFAPPVLVSPAQRSESEISVLLDHSSPIKAKAKKSKSESKVRAPPPTSKQPKNKDEEAVKRLKSFVVACGVRKIWSKEFKDLPTPSQQIAHLRNMLTELGMGSRPSLEQARAIKVRRELAQELEDVKEFDAAVNAPRKSRAAAPRHSLAESGAANVQSDEGEQPSASPRRSAFGFLAGQSSDEE
ncbi:hypothetical protein CTheo_1585 [Ceratobasidium theobromae]|uniref:Uncharacterized protein n=1 Tax=Ceratobasidium theobromae TaxID=1582974 RepID=A0A5N5QT68_9AGAM|nr:hypothetical protein CTheo_1585 [Ceratobasidium theobromae]